jgi:hypothetical protein
MSPFVVDAAVVHAEPVTDPAHRAIRRGRAIEGKAPDIADQAQQVSPAVAAGLGWWKVGSTVDTSSVSVEVPSWC